MEADELTRQHFIDKRLDSVELNGKFQKIQKLVCFAAAIEKTHTALSIDFLDLLHEAQRLHLRDGCRSGCFLLSHVGREFCVWCFQSRFRRTTLGGCQCHCSGGPT